jgi:hypothetical protein
MRAGGSVTTASVPRERHSAEWSAQFFGEHMADGL